MTNFNPAENQSNAAVAAATRWKYKGETTDSPNGISLMRWCAMIDSILKNGPPVQFGDFRYDDSSHG